MDAFRIQGGKPLRGSVRIHGSKNAALPLMAGALLTDQPLTLRDVPDLSDIRNMKRLLVSLGCPPPPQVRHDDAGEAPEGNCGETSGETSGGTSGGGVVYLHATDPSQSIAHYDIVRTMRAGICVLGPLLGKRGYARVSMPGGCAIGDRPVDLHLRGLEALGAQIHLDAGYIVAQAPGGPDSRLVGGAVFLGGPNGSTVLGTANVLCAATLAEGTTTIECAACEPEIEDLARLLTTMGAKITGAGTPRITVEGVDTLGGADHTVMADRIEAGTYLCAGAITNGDVVLNNFPTDCLAAALDRLREVGVEVIPEPTPDCDNADPLRQSVRVVCRRRLSPVHIVTQPHPGFPTDLQAQFMALLALADGNSIITEKIFPDRFLHVPELLRMGASIIKAGNSAMITGRRELIGAPVMASDLRASAGLVLAGLAAQGQTLVNRVYHLDRGYQRMERTLQELGADIERIEEAAV